MVRHPETIVVGGEDVKLQYLPAAQRGLTLFFTRCSSLCCRGPVRSVAGALSGRFSVTGFARCGMRRTVTLRVGGS
ncbi:hypothetical protein GPEL0_01r2565 [Geoanaerobacter pelophilus]|uniref:Uncharacterized protein n=1 Tax=Geoanaerobacter pelophilus TaxID=60036 RepID=A0ABQ0MIQ8_9BACT|nr:hypothetical protein GPEL0_01r2565 [Geoanaerobacter pelophilus]